MSNNVWAPGVASFDRLASGEIDLGLHFVVGGVRRLDAGAPIVFLAGIHDGCFDLLGHGRVRTIRDLKGKVVVGPPFGSGRHLLIASMAAYVGLDPQRDITWVVKSGREAMQFFIEGKADAFLGFPPEPQELRARKIGQVVVSTTHDRPWSQYLCCMLMANRAFVQEHPIATKRAMRAILKATDICAREPEATGRLMVERGYTDRYDLALQVIKEMPYGRWREHDAEDTVRFYACHDVAGRKVLVVQQPARVRLIGLVQLPQIGEERRSPAPPVAPTPAHESSDPPDNRIGIALPTMSRSPTPNTTMSIPAATLNPWRASTIES